MKYIRQYENHTKLKKAQETPIKEEKPLRVINESVEIIDDTYEVRVTTEIPQSLINSFIKKSETNLGNKVRKIYSDKDLAELLVTKVIKNNLDIEKLNPSDFFGSGQATTSEEVPSGTPTNEPPVELPPSIEPSAEPAPEEVKTTVDDTQYQSTEENLPNDQL
jgi:hypothetical protein